MIDYLGSFIVFMAALLAVKGGTWNDKRKGIGKLTKTGWATIIISFIGLIVSYWSVLETNKEKTQLNEKISELGISLTTSNTNLDIANGQLVEIRSELSSSREDLATASNTIFDLRRTVEASRNRQLNMDVEIINRYVELPPNDQRVSLRAVTGSIVKTYGFNCDVIIETDRERVRLRAGNPREVAIIGPPGQTSRVSFRRDLGRSGSGLLGELRRIGGSSSSCGGKVRISGTNH